MMPRKQPRVSILSAPPRISRTDLHENSSGLNKTIQIRPLLSETLPRPRGPALSVSNSSKKPDFSKSYSPSKEVRRSPKILLASLRQIKEVPRAKVHSLESWKKANCIHPTKKVFTLHGDYPDIKAALLNRGWVENSDENSSFYNLRWTRSSKLPSDLKEWQMINHFGNIYEISTKKHFCENIKRLHRYSIDPNTFFPRCFNLSDPTSYSKFLDAYHYQAVRET
jgi:hypothetical protein